MARQDNEQENIELKQIIEKQYRKTTQTLFI